MKIIFLDMDGVLCTIRSHVGQDQRGIMEALDREGVGLLNRLAETGDEPVQYVLSSTWRYNRDREWMTEHLRKYGWRGEFHEDWKTPRLKGFRGDEVQDWLSRHRAVQDYVILDDDGDFHPYQKSYRLVQTDPYDGIRWNDFVHAVEVLHQHRHAWMKTRSDNTYGAVCDQQDD